LENAVKTVIAIILLSVALSGCGTFGGAVGGAGEDLKKAGDWIKTR
jgi:predicted small secreted protein